MSDFITGGQDSVGLRVPSDPSALALIKEFEKISNSAIAAPSANRFGQVSPTSSADVQEELGRYLGSADQILDGGNSSIGIESTIIDCTNDSPSILRKGAVTRSEIVAILGDIILTKSSSETKFSGSFDKHYSPLAEIILDTEPTASDGFIAISAIPTPINVVRLSAPKDVQDFARSLYSSLRKADQSGIGRIVVAQPEGEGLAEAIRDRLNKASMGR